MNCEAVYEVGRNYGAPRHAKPVAAKRLAVRDYPSARVAVNAKTGADESATIHQKQASDGRWIVVEGAVCATHERTLKRGTITIPADVLGQMSWDGIVDYAARVYERKQAEAAERRAAEQARYAKHRQDEYDNVTFVIERDDEGGYRGRGIGNWEIRAVDPERGGENRPVAHVYVEVSEGRAWVRTGEYMNSGRGRGSLHYINTLMDAYKMAVTEAVKWNEANAA